MYTYIILHMCHVGLILTSQTSVESIFHAVHISGGIIPGIKNLSHISFLLLVSVERCMCVGSAVLQP